MNTHIAVQSTMDLLSGDDDEDAYFGSGKIQFSSVLDLNWWVLLKDELWMYFGKVHSTTGIGPVAGTVYFVILILQSLGPSLLLTLTSIWSQQDLVTQVVRIGSIIWQGPTLMNKSQRVFFSFFVLILFILALLFLYFRVRIFKKKRRMPSGEISATLIVYKMVLPLLCPHLLSGVSEAFFTFTTFNFFSIVVAVCNVPMFLFFMYFLHVFVTPRVILENTQTHEWIPLLQSASIGAASILTMCCTTVHFVSPTIQSVICVFMAIISGGTGAEVYFLSSLPRSHICVIVGTVGITASIVSMIQAFNVHYLAMTGYTLSLVIIVIIAVLFVVLTLNYKRILMKTMMLLDRIAEDPAGAAETFDANFKSSVGFVGKMRLVTEHWHPYIATWELFDYALVKWPHSENILLMYCRLVAMFPSQNKRMIKLARVLAQNRANASLQSYLAQFRQISRSRLTSVTNKLKFALDDVAVRREFFDILLRRVWEGILQKTSTTFWEDLERLNAQIDELELILGQLHNDYPNNMTVIKQYEEFESILKHDTVATEDLSRKAELLTLTGRSGPDVPQMMAMTVFPRIIPVMEEIQGEEDPFKEDHKVIINDDNMKLKAAMVDLMKRSPLGSYGTTTAFISVASIIVIVLFSLFANLYSSGIISEGITGLGFTRTVGKLMDSAQQLGVYINVYPLFLSGTIVPNPATMNTIAPTLYPQGKISDWVLDQETIVNESEKLKELTQVVGEYASTKASAMNLYQVKELGSGTLQSLLLKISYSSNTLSTMTSHGTYFSSLELAEINNDVELIKDRLLELSALVSKESISDFESRLPSFNSYLVLTIMGVLLLVTLPFMLRLFQLQLQSESIADSFTLFPNVEARRIVSELGKNTLKAGDDNTNTAAFHATSKSVAAGRMAMIFFISFVPLMVCSLIMYYAANSFSLKAESSTTGASVETKVPARLKQLAGIYARIYAIDQTLSAETRSVLAAKIQSMISAGFTEVYDGGTPYYYDLSTIDLGYAKAQTLFERLYSVDHLSSVDVEIKHLESIISGPVTTADAFSIFYWRTIVAETYEESMLQEVRESTESVLNNYLNMSSIIIFFVIMCQIVAVLLAIAFLSSRSKMIKASLRLYQSVRPTVLLQSRPVLSLIEKGFLSISSNVSRGEGFSHADQVLSKLAQGIVVLDRQLIIRDYNGVFFDMMRLADAELQLKPLEAHINDAALIYGLKGAIDGQTPPQFSVDIDVSLGGRQLSLRVDAIAMTAHRPAREDEHKEIEAIALLIEDTTEATERTKAVEQEKEKLSAALAAAMPSRVVSELAGGASSVAFVSQSATVAFVKIINGGSADKNPEEEDKKEDLTYADISAFMNLIDKTIKKYDNLERVTTRGNMFVFAGGLSAHTIRPERHAEEVCRATLEVLEQIKSAGGLASAGVHTGGPVVAGVIGVNRPTFQLIGPPISLAEGVARVSTPDTVIISRSVYELVFSAGFHIVESGDLKIKDTYMGTYVVSK